MPLTKALTGYDINLVITGLKKPLHFPIDSEPIQTMIKIYREFVDDDRSPLNINGGTYARAMDNLVAFGALLPNRELRAHQDDEYIEIRDLETCKKIYKATKLGFAAETSK